MYSVLDDKKGIYNRIKKQKFPDFRRGILSIITFSCFFKLFQKAVFCFLR